MRTEEIEEPTRPPPQQNGTDEAPAPDARKEVAGRILALARARPLAAFAAVLVAGYVLGRILRR